MQCYHIICHSIGHLLSTDRIAQVVLRRCQFVETKREERQGGKADSDVGRNFAPIALTRMSMLPIDLGCWFTLLVSRRVLVSRKWRLRQQCVRTDPKDTQSCHWVARMKVNSPYHGAGYWYSIFLHIRGEVELYQIEFPLCTLPHATSLLPMIPSSPEAILEFPFVLDPAL
jgi:hypothetical protein